MRLRQNFDEESWQVSAILFLDWFHLILIGIPRGFQQKHQNQIENKPTKEETTKNIWFSFKLLIETRTLDKVHRGLSRSFIVFTLIIFYFLSFKEPFQFLSFKFPFSFVKEMKFVVWMVYFLSLRHIFNEWGIIFFYVTHESLFLNPLPTPSIHLLSPFLWIIEHENSLRNFTRKK